MQSIRPSFLDLLSMPQVKVKGFALEFHIRSISHELFGRFLLNFTQMFLLAFLSMRLCAEPMTLLGRLKVKVTFHNNKIYPAIRARSISPEPIYRFSLNFTQMFLSVKRLAEYMIQLPRLKITGKGHGFTLEF